MSEYNFKEVLLKSQEAVYLMRDLFISKGFEVYVPELVIAPYNAGAFSIYADQGDMFVTKDGVETKLEIKHINTDFINDFPFKDIIVNSFTGYESKNIKPDVHIIINKNKTHYLTIRNETFPKWELRKTFDKIKQKELLFYYIQKSYAKYFKINL